MKKQKYKSSILSFLHFFNLTPLWQNRRSSPRSAQRLFIGGERAASNRIELIQHLSLRKEIYKRNGNGKKRKRSKKQQKGQQRKNVNVTHFVVFLFWLCYFFFLVLFCPSKHPDIQIGITFCFGEEVCQGDIYLNSTMGFITSNGCIIFWSGPPIPCSDHKPHHFFCVGD